MRLFSLFSICLLARVVFAQGIYVRFPDDVFLGATCSIDPAVTGEPQWYNPGSPSWVFTYEDIVYGIIRPDCCDQINRRWQLTDTLHHTNGAPCNGVPNPTPFPLTSYNPLIYAGPVVSDIVQPGDPWSATKVKIYFTDTVATLYSTFWSATATCYVYEQHLKLLDTVPPLLHCPAFPETFVDSTGNDPGFWNDPAWAMPNAPGFDLAEAPAAPSIIGYDSCYATGVNASYLLFLDLDRDSIWETVVRPGEGYAPAGYLRFGNAGNPGYDGGELRPFDNRLVPDNKKYRFDVGKMDVGGQAHFFLRWRTPYSPSGTETAVPQLPPGAYKIQWTLQDGCGQETNCEYPFAIVPPFVSGISPGMPESAGPGLRVWPNPACEQVHFNFHLPESEVVRLTVHDAAGSLTFEEEGHYPAGPQEIVVEKARLGQAAGLRYFTLRSGKFCQSGKLLLLP